MFYCMGENEKMVFRLFVSVVVRTKTNETWEMSPLLVSLSDQKPEKKEKGPKGVCLSFCELEQIQK